MSAVPQVPGHDASLCNLCGACCQWMPLYKRLPDGRTVRATKRDVEGWKKIAGYNQVMQLGPIPIYAGRGQGRHSYFRCGHLVQDGERWRCDIYERRPPMCRAYPVEIDESLPAACGYRALLKASARNEALSSVSS